MRKYAIGFMLVVAGLGVSVGQAGIQGSFWQNYAWAYTDTTGGIDAYDVAYSYPVSSTMQATVGGADALSKLVGNTGGIHHSFDLSRGDYNGWYSECYGLKYIEFTVDAETTFDIKGAFSGSQSDELYSYTYAFLYWYLQDSNGNWAYDQPYAEVPGDFSLSTSYSGTFYPGVTYYFYSYGYLYGYGSAYGSGYVNLDLASVIPAPGASLLGLIGLACLSLLRRSA